MYVFMYIYIYIDKDSKVDLNLSLRSTKDVNYGKPPHSSRGNANRN